MLKHVYPRLMAASRLPHPLTWAGHLLATCYPMHGITSRQPFGALRSPSRHPSNATTRSLRQPSAWCRSRSRLISLSMVREVQHLE